MGREDPPRLQPVPRWRSPSCTGIGQGVPGPEGARLPRGVDDHHLRPVGQRLHRRHQVQHCRGAKKNKSGAQEGRGLAALTSGILTYSCGASKGTSCFFSCHFMPFHACLFCQTSTNFGLQKTKLFDQKQPPHCHATAPTIKFPEANSWSDMSSRSIPYSPQLKCQVALPELMNLKIAPPCNRNVAPQT